MTRCPQCHRIMQEGFIDGHTGITWHRSAHAADGFREELPGTSAFMRRNRLPAWRCRSCDVVVFQYGREIAKRRDAELAKRSPPVSTSLADEDPAAP